MRYMLLVSLLMMGSSVLATTSPNSFSYQGRLFKANGVTPVDSATVTFTIQVRSPDGACLLFEETHFRDMSQSEGAFSLIIGEGTNTNATALNLLNVFDNSSGTKNGASCTYGPTAADFRRLRLTFDDGVDVVTLTPDQTIRSVPYALMASRLQGLTKDQFIQVSTPTTQNKVDTLLTSYAVLIDLISGTSNLYAKASDLPISGGILNLSSGGVRVSNTPAGGDYAINRNYLDTRLAAEFASELATVVRSGDAVSGDLSGTFGNPSVARIQGLAVSATTPTNGQVLKFSTSNNRWESAADLVNAGTVTSVTAGAGLTGGTISTSGTLSVNMGTGANQIVQLDASSRLPAVDGSQLTGMRATPPFNNMQVFNTSNLTWQVPVGVSRVFVQVWGAGGGGSGGNALSIPGGGGGGGGYGADFVNVTAGAIIPVTVGTGGAAGTSAGGSGATGGNSSFGAHVTATGGAGGTTVAGAFAAGGVSTAALSIAGSVGEPGILLSLIIGGQGGDASQGGAGGHGSRLTSQAGVNGLSPGGGGGGGSGALVLFSAGGSGGNGRVIVWY